MWSKIDNFGQSCMDALTRKLKFFWPIGKLWFFKNFSHGIYSIYVSEDMCVIGHTGNPSYGVG